MIDRTFGRVLDRQEGEVGGSREHRLDRLADGLVAGQEHSALAAAVAPLGGEVAVGALDPLVGQRGERVAIADNHVAALVAVLLVILFGLVSLARLPIQLTPEVERPTITITTSWRAAAPGAAVTLIQAGCQLSGGSCISATCSRNAST